MATLTFTSRTTTSVTFGLAAGGGETTFEMEISREPDFASDTPLVWSGLAAPTTTMSGLLPGVNYYFRARATNVAGAWSNVINVATLAPAALPAYSGFSIEPAILVVPEPVVNISCAQASAGSLPSALADDDPLNVLLTGAVASVVIEFQTTGRPVDVFALLGTTAGDGATWRIRGAATQAAVTSSPVIDTGAVSMNAVINLNDRPFRHAYRRLGQTYELMFWRIDIALGVTTPFMARHLVVGKARQSVNYSRSAGQEPFDLGQMARTPYAAPLRVPGWRGREIDFQLSWLSEAEYQTKWSDLERLVGQTFPVLALPNPKSNAYLNDRIAYGCITGMRGEHLRGLKYQRNLEIQSLY